jgi:hypothetical protein
MCIRVLAAHNQDPFKVLGFLSRAGCGAGAQFTAQRCGISDQPGQSTTGARVVSGRAYHSSTLYMAHPCRYCYLSAPAPLSLATVLLLLVPCCCSCSSCWWRAAWSVAAWQLHSCTSFAARATSATSCMRPFSPFPLVRGPSSEMCATHLMTGPHPPPPTTS